MDRSFENVIYHKPTVTTLLIRLGKCYLGVIYNPVISETIHGIKNSVRARNNRETIVMDMYANDINGIFIMCGLCKINYPFL